MSAIQTAIDNIRKLKANLIDNLDADAMIIAFDLTALIKLRIQTTGIDFEGQPFVEYAPLTKRLRKEGGYQIGHVDFTQTGRLWANVGPRIETSEPGKVSVVIEGRDAYSKEIIIKQAPKRGNIVKSSASETEFARMANEQRLLKRLTL